VSLNRFTYFTRFNATGTNKLGLHSTVRKNHTDFLEVRLLEVTMVLVGEADFVGLIATTTADFTLTSHNAYDS
jgi:hypothetical protein